MDDHSPTSGSQMNIRGDVLLLDQGFLKDRKGKPIHGVEHFRLMLLRQLLEQGIRCTVWFDRSWRKAVEERLGEHNLLRVRYTPGLGGTLTNALWAICRERGPYNTVVFGDARRGMIPAMRLYPLRGLGRRTLLFAHRRPHPRLLKLTGKLEYRVLAVSEFVAERFRKAGREVEVYYGLPNAEKFQPAEGGGRNSDVVNFCLLGRLPNISKGHELAIEAFQHLDPELRKRCRLHLASFIQPTDLGVEGVVAHEWIPSGEVPEFLRAMDVMLTLSSNETFSQAIVQGMLTGLPIIATPHPVFVEKLDTGGGLVVERTADAIADAMTRLANDPEGRTHMGAIGRATALERYVWRTDRFIREHLLPEPTVPG